MRGFEIPEVKSVEIPEALERQLRAGEHGHAARYGRLHPDRCGRLPARRRPGSQSDQCEL